MAVIVGEVEMSLLDRFVFRIPDRFTLFSRVVRRLGVCTYSKVRRGNTDNGNTVLIHLVAEIYKQLGRSVRKMMDHKMAHCRKYDTISNDVLSVLFRKCS